MPIAEDYSGDTFVAFTDISGFKAMMSNETRLMRAMDALYSSGYRSLRAQSRLSLRTEGIFISDCGILFVRRTTESELDALDSLLNVLAKIHRDVFECAFAITTSISFGQFAYRGKIEFDGLEKTAIHGNAYVSAFKDNEGKAEKLYPNECRILKKDLPRIITLNGLETLSIASSRIRDEDNYFYFDWMKRERNFNGRA